MFFLPPRNHGARKAQITRGKNTSGREGRPKDLALSNSTPKTCYEAIAPLLVDGSHGRGLAAADTLCPVTLLATNADNVHIDLS
jgi:hypothetical protein